MPEAREWLLHIVRLKDKHRHSDIRRSKNCERPSLMNSSVSGCCTSSGSRSRGDLRPSTTRHVPGVLEQHQRLRRTLRRLGAITNSSPGLMTRQGGQRTPGMGRLPTIALAIPRQLSPHRSSANPILISRLRQARRRNNNQLFVFQHRLCSLNGPRRK